MGVRRRLGCSHLPVWRCRPVAVRQGVRRDLLQGAKNRARRADARLGQAARPARRCPLDHHQLFKLSSITKSKN